MKVHAFCILWLTSLTAFSQASTELAPSSPAPNPTESSKFDPSLLGGSKPDLTEEEKLGVAVTDAWKDRSLQTMVGQPGSTSSVVFRFGESYPSIVCAVLEVTDVELEPGETVIQINVGDTVRWSVECSKSGSGTEEVQHIVIKPRDVGLQTSLIVETDRRTYHLLLRSNEGGFMYYVRFQYPQSSGGATNSPSPSPSPVAENAPASFRPVVADPPKRKTHSDGKQVKVAAKDPPVDDADESYVVSGNVEWKPVEVYSKDGKTYIELPASVRHKEAPVLFEEKKGGLFGWGSQKTLVNYRVQGRWWVADKVIDRAVLLSGVGSGQEKVVIKHVDAAAKRRERSNGE